MQAADSHCDGVTLFLCGDVMTGRGIDQILPHPSVPRLFEPYVSSAREYVALAERVHGPVDQPVDFAYVWGDALSELDRIRPVLRIVNLETAVTTSAAACPGKGIHYRMHPRNLRCLEAAGIDGCSLANNHSMDWGRAGLEETLAGLQAAGMRVAGAGRNAEAAAAPATFSLPGGGNLLLFACGTCDSGIPADWAAGAQQTGVCVLPDLSPRTVAGIAARVSAHKRRGDLAMMSVHWGGNWGYTVPEAQRAFAMQLIDSAGIDLVHGHSSHHAKGIEVHDGKLVLYGCGDFLNDYEGIGGYEAFRGDLGLMYFPTLDTATGRLVRLQLVPTSVRRLRINRATADDARWLCDMLTREGRKFGTAAELLADDRLELRWAASA